MIAYLKGRLAYKSPTEVIVEVGGIGYQVLISLATYRVLQALDEAMLLTVFLVKEDSHTLYGFATAEERAMFEHLVSVSGVGPNSARILLSTLSVEETRAAIIGENAAVLAKAKGLGPKTAKRIILELKEKMLKDSGATSAEIAAELGNPLSQLPADNPLREEALSALIALGFQKIAVQKVLNALLQDNPKLGDSGELIKLALGKLT